MCYIYIELSIFTEWKWIPQVKKHPETITEGEVARHWDDNADVWTEHVRRGWDTFREHLITPLFWNLSAISKGKRRWMPAAVRAITPVSSPAWARRWPASIFLPRLIAHARQAEKQEPLGIRYEIASFSDLSIFKDESFIRWFPPWRWWTVPIFDKAVAEIYRLLKKNGDFLFQRLAPVLHDQGFGWVTDRQSNQEKLTVSGYLVKPKGWSHWQFSQAPEEIKNKSSNCHPGISTYSGGIHQSYRQFGFYSKKNSGAAPFCRWLAGNILTCRNGAMPVRCFYISIAWNPNPMQPNYLLLCWIFLSRTPIPNEVVLNLWIVGSRPDDWQWKKTASSKTWSCFPRFVIPPDRESIKIISNVYFRMPQFI